VRRAANPRRSRREALQRASLPMRSPCASRRVSRSRVAALALGAVLALGAAGGRADEAPAFTPPTSLRGTLVLEPSRLELGDVAELEIAVVTPPGFGVRGAGPPPETPGFWLLSSETLPVTKEPGRWIHRTRLRVRAREVGRFHWPAWPMIVENADGAASPLSIEGRDIDVSSVLPEFTGREGPFGLRRAAGRGGGDPLWAAAAGALAMLALIGLVALVRRERRRRAARESGLEAGPSRASTPAWEDAGRAFDEAGREADPNAAADAIAAAIRRYLERRFGVSTGAFTTEELAAAATPFVVRSRWPRYLDLLRELDALRFPPAPEDASPRVAAALAEARALVADSTPRDDAPPRMQGSWA